MQKLLVVCGAFTVLVGLGFVCPQIANLRDVGELFRWQVLLLGLGVALAIGGAIVCGRAASKLVSLEQSRSGR